jgi:hypothetical protein
LQTDPSPQFCAWDGESTFRIVAEHTTVVGTPVAKVGIKTGWTEGEVTGVASRFFSPLETGLPLILLVGQVRADYGNEPGDSGVPVIEAPDSNPSGTPVDTALLGINWGEVNVFFQGGYCTTAGCVQPHR